MQRELVVEISGAAGSGKTLMASLLKEELQVLGFEVDNKDSDDTMAENWRTTLQDINRTHTTKVKIMTKLCKKDGT